jgi:hypothetical protein
MKLTVAAAPRSSVAVEVELPVERLERAVERRRR